MIDLEQHDPRFAWRKREFYLYCDVVRKSVNYFDKEENQQHTANIVMLVPYESTETSMFFTAWLPEPHNDTEENPSKIELPAWVEGPINKATKINVKRAGTYHDKHFLLIMPLFMETLLNNNKEVMKLRIKVFPEERMEEFEKLMNSYKVLPAVHFDEF